MCLAVSRRSWEADEEPHLEDYLQQLPGYCPADVTAATLHIEKMLAQGLAAEVAVHHGNALGAVSFVRGASLSAHLK